MPVASQPNDPPHRFSADRALDKLSDDRLDRGTFAKRLAADILGWHGKDSLVISLNGAWGSGKTSLKNFIKECAEADGKPIIVEFNSWEWSGQEKLIEGFFGALRAKFLKTDEAKETEAMAALFEALESWTKLGAEITEQVGKALSPLVGVGGSVLIALVANATPSPVVRSIGLIAGVAGVVVSVFFPVAAGLAGQGAQFYRRRATRAARTLAELRAEISSELNKLREHKRPVLVIVDDIDRLTAEETRLLFQLVKVNADFPNLVYLLLFQKNLVTDALGKVSADTGEEYLKKIVQVDFDLPQASRPRMLDIFLEGLNRILNGTEIKMQWDKDRFLGLFEEELWPYFHNLRDVKRFLGTFDFYFNGHVRKGVLHVNPVDLLIIEVLRSFDYSAYLAVRDSLGYASRTNVMQLLMGTEQRKKEVRLKMDAILDRPELDADKKARLRTILSALFPEEMEGDFLVKAERGYRVCHPDYFARYFEHNVDDRATSPSNVLALLDTVGDRVRFADRLREWIQTKELEPVLKKLQVHFDDIPVTAAESFMGALFDVGEELPPAKVDWFTREPVHEAARMIYFMLKKLPDSATRAYAVQESLLTSPGVVVPTSLVALLEPRKDSSSSSSPLIVEADLTALRQEVLTRIKALAHSGGIWASRFLGLFLFRWRDWEGQNAVNEWLQRALDTPQRKLEFLTQMVNERIINGHKVEHFLDAKTLEAFVNLEDLARDIGTLPASSSPTDKTARVLLDRALLLKVAGKGYGEVQERGDFDPEPTTYE